MSFLGPKPTQDPMNTVFEQKKFLGEKFSGSPQAAPKQAKNPPTVAKKRVLGITLARQKNST